LNFSSSNYTGILLSLCLDIRLNLSDDLDCILLLQFFNLFELISFNCTIYSILRCLNLLLVSSFSCTILCDLRCCWIFIV
jgi:hypothetical protein